MSAAESLEAAVGFTLPPEYGEFVAAHHADDEPSLFIECAGERRDVRCLFDLKSEDVSYNALGVFKLVAHALPAGTVPIGMDWAGNLYLLVCSGPKVGTVVWWDHERLPEEDHVEEVCSSFSQFLRALVRGEP